MTKYVNNNGVSEMWLNIKNWVTSQLLGYSQTGHTHTKSQITDLDLSNYVDKTSNQTVGGQKLFSHSQTGVGRDIYHFASNPYSKNTPPANISFQYIWFTGNNASQGLTNSWYGGYLEQRIYTDGSAQGRWFIRDTSESSLGIELFVNGSNKQFRPQGNNITDLGSSTNKWKSVYSNAYYLGNTAFGDIVTHNASEFAQVGHTHSASDITSGLSTVATSGSYNDLSNKPTIPSKTSDLTNDSGFITSDNTKIPLAGSNQISGDLIPATDNAYNLGSNNHNYSSVYAYNFPSFMRAMSPSDTTDIFLIAGTDIFYGAYLQLSSKDTTSGSVAGSFRLTARDSSNQAEIIGKPNGTLTWSGSRISATRDNYEFNIDGGMGFGHGSTVFLTGKNSPSQGAFYLIAHNGTNERTIIGSPDGSLTWNGQSIQTISDQRFKQQISQIDDDLLTAWEDVELSQFKYNDAVEQKGNTARLHTGYVVQQIDEACKSHGVDVSKYGLYCHEEYEEETREVEHEDGTKTVEVVRPANEHYSLRYTEALIVECAYLRKCIKELRTEIEELKSSK